MEGYEYGLASASGIIQNLSENLEALRLELRYALAASTETCTSLAVDVSALQRDFLSDSRLFSAQLSSLQSHAHRSEDNLETLRTATNNLRSEFTEQTQTSIQLSEAFQAISMLTKDTSELVFLRKEITSLNARLNSLELHNTDAFGSLHERVSASESFLWSLHAQVSALSSHGSSDCDRFLSRVCSLETFTQQLASSLSSQLASLNTLEPRLSHVELLLQVHGAMAMCNSIKEQLKISGSRIQDENAQHSTAQDRLQMPVVHSQGEKAQGP